VEVREQWNKMEPLKGPFLSEDDSRERKREKDVRQKQQKVRYK
jgi:hypothetical protein